MNLLSFTDELIGTPACRGALVKTARAGLVERLTAAGALAGLAGHGASSVKAGLSANPYDAPRGSALGAAARTGGSGALAALLLKALGRIGSRGR